MQQVNFEVLSARWWLYCLILYRACDYFFILEYFSPLFVTLEIILQAMEEDNYILLNMWMTLPRPWYATFTYR